MGSALGARLREGGAHVVTTLAGRSDRSGSLAESAGLEALPSLEAVVAEAHILLSVVPPGEARTVARNIAAAATSAGEHPLVIDLNAVAPTTVAAIADVLASSGVDLVDGSISGPPPDRAGTTRMYLSGARAGEVAA